MPAILRLYLSLLCLLGIHWLCAQDIGQRMVTVPTGQHSMSEVLAELKNQGIPLAYSQDVLPDLTCQLAESPVPLTYLLNTLKAQTGINFSLTSGLVAISYLPRDIRYTIRGAVRDARSGEVLIGATVSEPGTSHGVVTNNYGYFSLSLSAEKHPIKISFMGFESRLDTIDLSAGGIVDDFSLQPRVSELAEVVVSAIEPDFNIISMVPGYNTLNLSTEGQIPYFLGEVDVLQGATMLPGIKTLGEDANGLNIRGGSTDQNLILLDEATVYNPTHLYGLISIFNPEAVNNVEIMKGFIPPKYGGRASSVISVHQKEGDYQNYRFTGGIGLVSAKFIGEGPIRRDESSFILSGRQSLFDLSFEENSNISFQDLNAKVNWRYNKQNTLFFSGYFGNDRNKNSFETVRNWGNRNFSFRWNHLFGKRVFANFSSIISEYNYKITQPQEAASFIGQSKIIDYTLKSDWGFLMNPNHEFNFGGSMILHRLKPGERVPFDEQTSSANPIFLDTEHGLESAFYVSHQTTLGTRLSLLYGLRLSSLHYLGPSEVYHYDPDQPRSDESILDTTSYQSTEVVDTYYGLEPRISINYQLNDRMSIKSSYTKSYQYLHLISSTITPSPTDIWKLSDVYIPPTMSRHYSLGYFLNFKDNQWETYVDAYYKSIDDLVAYKNGADLLFNDNPETELLTGSGRAYGVEFFVKKNKGQWTGWLSYALARSETKVDGRFSEEIINGGAFFPSNHDKIHELSLVSIYQFLPRLSASASFNYNTGRPFTLPLGKYEYEGNLVPHFGDRNGSRLPNYHRLDLSVKWQGKKYKADGTVKSYRDYWTLVVYNAYGRDNVYSYFFEEDELTGDTSIEAYSIFDSVIPAITYNFKF